MVFIISGWFFNFFSSSLRFIHFLCNLFMCSFRYFSSWIFFLIFFNIHPLEYSFSSSSSSAISRSFIFLLQDRCSEFVFGKNSKYRFCCLVCLYDYKISLSILYFIMNIVFVFVCGMNSKFRFRFKCLEDLNITIRILYFIMKIVSLKFFTIIYTKLFTIVYHNQHDCLPISTRLFTIFNMITWLDDRVPKST